MTWCTSLMTTLGRGTASRRARRPRPRRCGRRVRRRLRPERSDHREERRRRQTDTEDPAGRGRVTAFAPPRVARVRAPRSRDRPRRVRRRVPPRARSAVRRSWRRLARDGPAAALRAARRARRASRSGLGSVMAVASVAALQFHTPFSSSCGWRQFGGIGGIGLPGGQSAGTPARPAWSVVVGIVVVVAGGAVVGASRSWDSAGRGRDWWSGCAVDRGGIVVRCRASRRSPVVVAVVVRSDVEAVADPAGGRRRPRCSERGSAGVGRRCRRRSGRRRCGSSYDDARLRVRCPRSTRRARPCARCRRSRGTTRR